jgi:Na+-transporting NADH:ubiquinone oxidoreductase subunit A
MSKTVKLKRGFDINLVGKANPTVGGEIKSATYAFKPADFVGISRPKLLVEVGDNVKAGTPLLYDKQAPEVMYCAPVSGEVVEVVRGEKRRILEIKILADKVLDFESFDKCSQADLKGLDKDEAKAQMLRSGVWPNIIQRPFGLVANPNESPKAIFVSGFDSHPLAPDFDVLFKGDEHYFQAGLDVLSKFTDGKVHLNLKEGSSSGSILSKAKGVDINTFSGPHPAGNVGVQIHHLDPINKGDVVWTVAPFGVIQIGKLFLEGKFDTSRVIALVGSEVSQPQYYKIHQGAQIKDLVHGKLSSSHVRIISGNVLTGEKVDEEGYLGFYHHQVTVIPEGDQPEFLGWILPGANKLSFHRAFGLLSFLMPKKEYRVDTNMNGQHRAFVQSGVFEQVTPMDIYPTYLLKSIMAEDYDGMEQLGIYEVIEEDLALCEYVDVSKHNVQQILREGLDLLQNS